MKHLHITVITLFLVCNVPIFAHANVSLEVVPLVIDIEAEARDILHYDIVLTNTGSQPLTVFPIVNNISLEKGGTAETFLPPVRSDRTASLASWIEIPRSGIKLLAGESHTVTMTLRIHPTPEPGEYHARIAFGPGRNQQIAETLVKSGRAPSTVLNVTIEDDARELLKLSRFIIDKFITSGGNEGATYIITNPGDETLVPSGEIIFYNSRGIEVAALPVNEDGSSIPPGEEKAFTAEVPVDGLFGKYKAFLSVEYGSAQLTSVQDTTFFYVLPLKTLLFILGTILLMSAAAAFYVHKRYFDSEEADDSDPLPVRIRDTQSEAKEHDIDLKQQ